MKLNRWREMANYQGLDYSEYFIAAQRMFRCSKLEQATFAYIREHMHGIMDMVTAAFNRDMVIDVTFDDDCLVHRYMVLVHKDFERGVRMAEMFAARLDSKGYVDPESADVDTDDEFEEYEKLPSPVVFNAPPPSGRYLAVKGFGGIMTSQVDEPKSYVRLREAEKRKALLAETGSSPVARSIDGIRRRWAGVVHGHDDTGESDSDPIQA